MSGQVQYPNDKTDVNGQEYPTVGENIRNGQSTKSYLPFYVIPATAVMSEGKITSCKIDVDQNAITNFNCAMIASAKTLEVSGEGLIDALIYSMDLMNSYSKQYSQVGKLNNINIVFAGSELSSQASNFKLILLAAKE